MFDVRRAARAPGGRGRDDAPSSPTRTSGTATSTRRTSTRTREYNDFAAELLRAHPPELAALGTATPWRGDDHVREAERARSRELGLVGPRDPDERRRALSRRAVPDAFWELVAELDVPVFIHPGGTVVGNELMAMYRLGEVCGRPLDTTVTLARLILTGGLERHPRRSASLRSRRRGDLHDRRSTGLRARASRRTRRSGRGATSSCRSLRPRTSRASISTPSRTGRQRS